jgi:hypothetical protein
MNDSGPAFPDVNRPEGVFQPRSSFGFRDSYWELLASGSIWQTGVPPFHLIFDHYVHKQNRWSRLF